MPLSVLFYHGWGFNASFWEPLCSLLPEYAHQCDDAGYFGTPSSPEPTAPYIAVTHSFGTMRFLATPPPGMVGLVVISGFDRFTETEGFPGTSHRVVNRMISALAQAPETVLSDFHKLFDSTVPQGTPIAARLQADLECMRDGDLRDAAVNLAVPILSLQAQKDTLLPMSLRETVFAAVGGVMRHTHPSAGHLLPRDDAPWCANTIRHFASTLG